jgi:hypothetical protein
MFPNIGPDGAEGVIDIAAEGVVEDDVEPLS